MADAWDELREAGMPLEVAEELLVRHRRHQLARQKGKEVVEIHYDQVGQVQDAFFYPPPSALVRRRPLTGKARR